MLRIDGVKWGEGANAVLTMTATRASELPSIGDKIGSAIVAAGSVAFFGAYCEYAKLSSGNEWLDADDNPVVVEHSLPSEIIISEGVSLVPPNADSGEIEEELDDHIADTDVHLSSEQVAKIAGAVVGVTPMITNATRAEQVCGKNLNNLPVNTVACVGSTLGASTLANQPCTGFRGNIFTAAYNPAATSNGVMQIAVSAEGVLYTRIKWGQSVWTHWETHQSAPDVYVVTPSDSLTGLFYNLRNDNREKIIYVQGGEYDIFAEYKALNMPSPPDNVSTGDYFDYCVFVPNNTKLIGIGNVKLIYNPAKSATTVGEAKTWSPLTIKYACHIENIEIYCKYGRYCIHDDSHNDTSDQGVTHYYKNVKCVYDYSEDNYGFNETIGFGFSQKSTYIFENCTFIYNEDAEVAASKNRSAFYGHSASGSQAKADSARLIVKDCICVAGETSTNAFRLQSLNTSDLRIVTDVSNTYIDGKVKLTIYDATRKQAFDVQFLHSDVTAENITIDDDNNAYPVHIYG